MAIDRDPSGTASMNYGTGAVSFETGDDYTMCGFVFMDDVSALDKTVIQIGSTAFAQFHKVTINAAETWEITDGGPPTTGGRTVNVNDWHFWGVRGTSTSLTLFSRDVGASPETALTTEGSIFFPTNVVVTLYKHFDDSGDNEPLAGRQAGIRVWHTLLSLDELLDESYFLTPQHELGNLHAWIPLVATVRDDNLTDFGPHGFAVSFIGASEFSVFSGPNTAWGRHDVGVSVVPTAAPAPVPFVHVLPQPIVRHTGRYL